MHVLSCPCFTLCVSASQARNVTYIADLGEPDAVRQAKNLAQAGVNAALEHFGHDSPPVEALPVVSADTKRHPLRVLTEKACD